MHRMIVRGFLFYREINVRYILQKICSQFLSDPTSSIAVIWVNFFQTELMVEIYPKSLVRASGKVLLMKFS